MTIKLGLQIPNFSYGTGVDRALPHRDRAGPGGRGRRLRLRLRDGPLLPTARARDAGPADARGLHGAGRAWPPPPSACSSAPWSPATPTATRRCWPRRSPRSTWSAQGRAILGIGTGWFELEHDQLGYEFGTFTDRFNKLGEALQIILPMLKGERPTVNGKYYRTQEAMAEPALPRPHPADDRRQRREEDDSVGRQALRPPQRHRRRSTSCPRKVQVVKERCEEIGRDPATLETSMLVMAVIDENGHRRTMIPEDFRRTRRVGTPETDRRADQDQGARRGRRRRDPEPLPTCPATTRCDHRRRREALKPLLDGLNKLTAVANLTDVDAPSRDAGRLR